MKRQKVTPPGTWYARTNQVIYDMKDGRPFKTIKGLIVDPAIFTVDAMPQGTVAELNRDTVFVPVPRSGVSAANPTQGVWPSYALCTALLDAGYGNRIEVAIRRVTAVPSSHRSRNSDDRPDVERHRDSFGVSLKGLVGASNICLVDDVLTRGATMMGAFQALRSAGVTAPCFGFTAGRILRDHSVTRAIVVPNLITWTPGDDASWSEIEDDASPF